MKCEKREFSFDFKQILHPVHPQCSHKQTNPSFDFIKMSIRNIRTNGPIKFCSQYPHADRTRFAFSVFFFMPLSRHWRCVALHFMDFGHTFTQQMFFAFIVERWRRFCAALVALRTIEILILMSFWLRSMK